MPAAASSSGWPSAMASLAPCLQDSFARLPNRSSRAVGHARSSQPSLRPHQPRLCPLVRPAPLGRGPPAPPSATLAQHAASSPPLTLDPIARLEGEVTLPGSKSLSNRCLLLAALAEGTTELRGLLDAEDIRVMAAALLALGVEAEVDWARGWASVRGCGGRVPAKSASLFLGNAGTAMRPLLAALAAAGRGRFELDGVPRMRERPIQDLVDALGSLGVRRVECLLGTGCPPVLLETDGLRAGQRVQLSGAVSSQYLSALLMAAPLAESRNGRGPRARGDAGGTDPVEGTAIEVPHALISTPYVAMTMRLMERFGARVDALSPDLRRLFVPGDQLYQAPTAPLLVEGDASSASYFLAGAAVTGGRVRVRGCGRGSLQGDARFAAVLERMGARVTWGEDSIEVQGPPRGELRGVDADCLEIPDAAMTLAVAALFARGPTAVRSVGSWRVKETERMRAVVDELRKMGAAVEEGDDYCVVQPMGAEKWRPAQVETYDDHRMAMAFSLAACGGAPVTILDPGCTRKTFPTYFEVLDSLVQRE